MHGAVFGGDNSWHSRGLLTRPTARGTSPNCTPPVPIVPIPICGKNGRGKCLVHSHAFGRNYGTRYGNAVEIYGGCDGFTVTDNYIYQLHDAGITQQVTLTDAVSDEVYRKNLYYAHNVIEYCNYSIEYFLSNCAPENPSYMENFVIEDNYMWYAGEGLCEQRPDNGQGSHINGWGGANNNRAVNYVIRDNLMLYSKQILVWIASNLYNPDGNDSMPAMSGNHFLQTRGGTFGMVAQDAEEWQVYDEKIPAYLRDNAADNMFWYEK